MVNAPTVVDVAQGPGWRLRRMDCRAGAHAPEFEEAHDAHVMAIVERGSFTYHGARGRALLHPGAILTAQARQCYACGHAHDGGDTCLALQVEQPLFEEMASAATGVAQFVFPLAALPVTRNLLPLIACVPSTQQTEAAEDWAYGFAEAVMCLAAGQGRGRDVSLSDHRRIELTLRHVEAHLADTLILQQLSDVAKCSRFHFSRVFKKVVGTTPYRYVLQQRMKRAAQALRETKRPVLDIAMASGFGDLSTFNTGFKSVYGRTPSRFRLG